MHETIHAEMYRKLLSLTQTPSFSGFTRAQLENLLSKGDFPGIYDYFRKYVKQWQHQQMAGHYVSVIAQALKEYDRSQHSDQFYNDLAWDGLIGYKDANGNIIYFEAWNMLSTTDKNRIMNTINNFRSTGNKNCP